MSEPEATRASRHQERVVAEFDTETFSAIATVASGAERRVLYERCAAEYPQLAHYQAATTREIRIVVIARRGQDQAARSADAE